MNTAADQLLTADQFLERYGDCSGVELIDGRVVRAGGRTSDAGGVTMPMFRHGVVCHNANRIFGDFIRANRLGWVATNDTFVRTTPGRVRGADVLYVSYARVPKIPPPQDLTAAPELVVEVRSPSDRIGELTDKAGEYLRAGVTVVVVVDPEVRSVAVFRDDELPYRLANGDELTLPDVLPGFSARVADFFD